jgi:hypothetical protein
VIRGFTCRDLVALQLLEDLQNQAKEPNSTLLQGSETKHLLFLSPFPRRTPTGTSAPSQGISRSQVCACNKAGMRRRGGRHQVSLARGAESMLTLHLVCLKQAPPPSRFHVSPRQREMEAALDRLERQRKLEREKSKSEQSSSVGEGNGVSDAHVPGAKEGQQPSKHCDEILDESTRRQQVRTGRR